MKHAVVMTATALCACAPLLGPIEAPLPGDKVKDAATAMAVAKALCGIPAPESWLSPYRWRAERQGGIWHVRVPSLHYGIADAYAVIDIRASDGTSAEGCHPQAFGGLLFIGGQ